MYNVLELKLLKVGVGGALGIVAASISASEEKSPQPIAFFALYLTL